MAGLTIKEIQERNAALKAAQRAGAVAGQVTASNPPLASNVQTGVQGSTESVPQIETPPVPDKELNEELAKTAKAVYQDDGLKKFPRPNGEWVRPTNGYFYVNEDFDIGQLEYFASIGKVVRIEIEADKK